MRQKTHVVDRNYKIYTDTSLFKEDDYIEITTGRHSEKSINEGSIFINKNSFMVIVGIIKKHHSKYDNYEMKKISRTTGMKIINNCRDSAEKILSCKGQDILTVLEYKKDKSTITINGFIKCKYSISKMLIGMADYIENAYEDNEWICIMEVLSLTNRFR